MRKLLATAAVLAFAISSATAADLAPRYTKAPPIPAPVWSWTGFYVGGHVGGGWSDGSARTTITGIGGLDTAVLGQNGSGVVGGGQIGYNWQFAPNWVLGIEGDVSGTGIRKTTVAPITAGGIPIGIGFNQIAERDFTWLATVRGRFGYAADRWLIYATGGGAWGEANYTAGPTFPGAFNPATFSSTKSGWTAGGGVEYAVTNNWTVRAEYLYYDLSGTTFVNPGPAPAISATTRWDHTRLNVVRAGVNYKF